MIIQPQYGALPYLHDEHGRIKVLLVTSRGSGRWIIPKGWPIRNLSGAATAAREAYEEAGVVGSVVSDSPVGLYRYEKRQSTRKAVIFEVAVYLLAVERQLRKWPEKAERETRWFEPRQASALVVPAGLAQILHAFVDHPLVGAAGA